MNRDALDIFELVCAEQSGANRRSADAETHGHGTDDESHRKRKTDGRELHRAEAPDEIRVGDVIRDQRDHAERHRYHE